MALLGNGGATIIQAGSHSAFFVTLGLAYCQLFAHIYVVLDIRPIRLYAGYWRTGPEVPQEASPLPVPPPPPRPVINFTTNCSPHHAGCEASTITNTHVPFIATARATPGT